MKRIRIGCLGVVIAAVLPLPSFAKCALPAFEVPVTISGSRAITKVRINGVEEPFIVDSGHYYSAITEAAAAQLHLATRFLSINTRHVGLTGEISYRQTRVERVGFQNMEIANAVFLVGGNEMGEGAIGLLGRNLLGREDTEYDLAHGMVRLVRPSEECATSSLAYWAGSTPVLEVPLQRSHGEAYAPINVEVLINGKPVSATLDTGAHSILSLRAAKRVGIVTDAAHLTNAGIVHGAGEGESRSWTVPVASFEMSGERITNTRLRVADFESDEFDMLIGIDYFLSHRIYVARSQQRLYLTYNGGPVFDLSTKAARAATPLVDELVPHDAAGFALRGAIALRRSNLTAALSDFDRACELAPTVATYFTQRGRVRVRMRQFPQALADLSEALRLDPSDYEARFDRAQVNLALKKTAVTLDDLQILTQTIPTQVDLRLEIGELYVEAGLPKLAVPQFSHWIDFHGDDIELPGVLHSRCWARALGGIDLDLAVKDCTAALDAKPNSAAYFDSRGLAYLRKGELTKALKDYETALSLEPKLGWSLYGRGLIRQRMGSATLGLADMEAAKKVSPEIEAEVRRYGVVVP